MQTYPHPVHLRNRIEMARRLANVIEAMAVTLGRPLTHTVEMLLSLDEDHAAEWWEKLARSCGERIPSEATVAATIAMLVERSA